ncbi:hypothetical protein L485_10130 [Sphingobium baderi LL03]|uniref:DUF3175 domain-containing protein n=2 Tax=Sphingobium TaxID=165695 RepID=T0GM72_9SPHN|nr:hypothetical protein L485_10130 [Sphingobium baderi LL03]
MSHAGEPFARRPVVFLILIPPFRLEDGKMTKNGKWSRKATEESDALDLERDIFTLHDPRKIAASLKRSAEASRRRKSGPFRSAMSMLTFYINRAGEGLDARQRQILEQAKDELRIAFGKPRKA